jgi:hypothetical protein
MKILLYRGFGEYGHVNNSYDMKKSPSANELGYGDSKFDGMEKTMSFLMEQVGNLEKMLYNESRRNKSYFETDKERAMKLENALKLSEDNVNILNSELLNKISLLETRLVREEKGKTDLRERVIFYLKKKNLFSLLNQKKHSENC